MAVGKGGSLNNTNQNSSFNGTTTGQTDTTGTQTGSSTTTGTQTGTQTGQNTVDTTAGYRNVSDLLQGMLTGGGGLTPQQIAAMGTNTASANNTGNAIDYSGKVLSQYVGNNHPAYQIASADRVTAPGGSSYIGDYTNPFERQVVDATTADMTQGLQTGLNALKASYGGQLGNGREGVAAGQAVGDYARALGTTLGNLRSGNYSTAVAAGQGDAARQLSANSTNAANNIGVNQFNVGQQNVNDQQSIGAINDYVNQQLQKNSVTSGAANTNAAMSQGGVGNLFGFLNSQVPAFGTSSSGTSTGTSGSTTNTTLENILKSISSGTTSGNSSSSGSSVGKNGGVSF